MVDLKLVWWCFSTINQPGRKKQLEADRLADVKKLWVMNSQNRNRTRFCHAAFLTGFYQPTYKKRESAKKIADSLIFLVTPRGGDTRFLCA